MKPLIMILMALCVAMVVSACNTIKGAGRDISSVGHGIERIGDGP